MNIKKMKIEKMRSLTITVSDTMLTNEQWEDIKDKLLGYLNSLLDEIKEE
jgi:hypothetical protein